MTAPSPDSLRRAGALAATAGSLLVAAGVGAWCLVTRQLRDERITVPDDAPVLGGRVVQDPATAFVQSLVIRRNAERGSDGRTFAEVSDALRTVESGSNEERALRGQSAALSTAAALRSALMTSVLAYGVSAMAAGLGAALMLVGRQLRRAIHQ